MPRSFFNIDASRRAHPMWWSPGAMRFFSTRVSECSERLVTVDGEPGCVFVTSEVLPYSRRVYSVRLHTAADTETIGKLGAYASRSKAVAACNRFAAVYPWEG